MDNRSIPEIKASKRQMSLKSLLIRHKMRKIIVNVNVKYLLYHRKEETIDHFFKHCVLVKSI